MKVMKGILSLLLLIAVSSAHGRPLKPEDFAYGQDLQVSAPVPYCQFTISDDIYRGATRLDLADMAIFNGRGEPVPFLVRPQEPEGSTNVMVDLPLYLLNGKVMKPATGMSVEVMTEREKARVLVSPAGTSLPPGTIAYLADTAGTKNIIGLELQWQDGPDFLEKVRVEATDDLENWMTVMDEGTVAKLTNQGNLLERRNLEFPSISAKYIRLTFAEGSKVPRLIKVRAKRAVPGARERRYLSLEGSKGESPGEYIYNLPGAMPIDRLRLLFSEQNVVKAEFLVRNSDKEPWRYVGSGTMYKLLNGAKEITSPELTINSVVARQLLVRIGNSTATNELPQLSVGWVPQRVIFIPSGAAPFYVAYGSSTAVVERHQELLSVVEQRRESPVEVALGPQKELGGEKVREEHFVADWKKIVLWVVLTAGVGLLVWMSLRLHKQMEADRKGSLDN